MSQKNPHDNSHEPTDPEKIIGTDLPQRPVVFISYSHDSKEHKMWVLELAQKLVKKNIDAKIDQWDLDYGDDVPKFMEKWVTEADRVLMICTETYVSKANEGVGGVGYEATVVTGELVQNLGSKKFVPIIRQNTESFKMPTCINTRLAVNLSSKDIFDAEFEKLIASLKRERPSSKPQFPEKSPTIERADPPDRRPIDNESTDYESALIEASHNRIGIWRGMAKRAKADAFNRITKWRESIEDRDKNPSKEESNSEKLETDLLNGMNCFEDLFKVVIAGIESGNPSLATQEGLLFDFAKLPNWKRSGRTYVVTFPELLIYSYQCIYGASCIQNGQAQNAIKLANIKLPPPITASKSDFLKLYEEPNYVGWPNPLDHTCTKAWSFIQKLPQNWDWLNEAFGGEQDYKASVSSYYLTLSWIEFIDDLSKGKSSIISKDDVRLCVPTSFLVGDEGAKAFQLFLQNKKGLIEYAESLNVSRETQYANWTHWVRHCDNWVSNVYSFSLRYHSYPRSTFENLIHEIYS